MRVSQCSVLRRARPSLDLVHAHADTDTPLFEDRDTLRGVNIVWGAECRAQRLLQFPSIREERAVP